MSDVEFLKKVEVCKGLSDHELGQVLAVSRLDSCPQGANIHAEKGAAVDMFVLVEGRVELRHQLPGRGPDQFLTISTILPTESFGWSAFVPPHQYTAAAFCLDGPARFFRLGRKDMLALFEQEPRAGYLFMSNLNGVIGHRFRALQEELARFEGFDAMHGW